MLEEMMLKGLVWEFLVYHISICKMTQVKGMASLVSSATTDGILHLIQTAN